MTPARYAPAAALDELVWQDFWLGGQKPRGIALAARAADGWLTPGNRAGDIAYFVDRRDALLRSFEAIGRDPSGFQFAGQVICGADPAQRREALEAALSLVRAGATHMILGLPAAAGPEPFGRRPRRLPNRSGTFSPDVN